MNIDGTSYNYPLSILGCINNKYTPWVHRAHTVFHLVVWTSSIKYVTRWEIMLLDIRRLWRFFHHHNFFLNSILRSRLLYRSSCLDFNFTRAVTSKQTKKEAHFFLTDNFWGRRSWLFPNIYLWGLLDIAKLVYCGLTVSNLCIFCTAWSKIF